MKKLTVLMMAVVFGLALAAGASATPIGDNGVEDNLQEILDKMTVAPVLGKSSVNVYTDQVGYDEKWKITATGGSVATMIIELSAWNNVASFGVYDASNVSTSVELFDGSAFAGSQVTLSIDATGKVFVDHVFSGVTFSSKVFGYYINSPTTGGGQFYSDTSLNADKFDHMVAYQGENDEVILPVWGQSTWTPSEYVLGFEDTYGGGDYDYQDLVVMVESVKPVPEPSTLLLLGAGLAGLGYLGRRKKNA